MQSQRGGRVKLFSLEGPETNLMTAAKELGAEGHNDALFAMESCLALLKLDFHKLQGLQSLAEKLEDGQLAQYLEETLEDHVSNAQLSRCCNEVKMIMFSHANSSQRNEADDCPPMYAIQHLCELLHYFLFLPRLFTTSLNATAGR